MGICTGCNSVMFHDVQSYRICTVDKKKKLTTFLWVNTCVGVVARRYNSVLIYLDVHSHCSNLFRLFAYRNYLICLTSKVNPFVSLLVLSRCFYLCLSLLRIFLCFCPSLLSSPSIKPFLSPLFSLPCFQSFPPRSAGVCVSCL